MARAALAYLLEDRRAAEVEHHLKRMAELDEADCRNGGYTRHLLTGLGLAGSPAGIPLP